MREKLKAINNIRAAFRGTVARFGSRTSYGHVKKTMLVHDIRDRHDREMTDHVWFLCGKWTEGLQPGDVIEFDARVTSYKKGYRGRREDYDLPAPSIDYKLSHPTHVRKVTQLTGPTEDRLCPPPQNFSTQRSLF